MRVVRQHTRGFTLVEILVVVGILALLAAIIFPVAKGVRDSARTSSCASNLAQIGTAVSLYIADNNQRFPMVRQPTGCTWVDAIYPYAKSTQVFKCPADPIGAYIPGCSAEESIPDTSPPQINGFNGSYDMVTPFVHSEAETTPTGSGRADYVDVKIMSLSQYKFPSSTIFALDGGDGTYFFHYNNAAINPGVDPVHNVSDLNDGGVFPRHGNGVNLLFVDGHVKWRNLDALTSTPMWRPDGREPEPTPVPSPTP